MNIIKQLIQQEIDRGKKQIELARDIGVSQGTIHKILYTETHPTTETIMKVAKYFQLPITAFISNEYHESNTAGPVHDAVTAKIMQILKNLPMPVKQDILRYTSERKLLVDIMKKSPKKYK